MVVCWEVIPVDATAVEVWCIEGPLVQVSWWHVYYLPTTYMYIPTLTACQCQNGGTCSGSVCTCPPGYTGALCNCPTSCPTGSYLNNCSCGKYNVHRVPPTKHVHMYACERIIYNHIYGLNKRALQTLLRKCIWKVMNFAIKILNGVPPPTLILYTVEYVY